MNICELASIKSEIQPKNYLKLLTEVVARLEKGNSNSITLRECKSWGLTEQDAIHGLFLLVRTGILSQKVAVYDEDEECFEDIRSTDELKYRNLDEIRFWFFPSVKGEELSPFFSSLPSHPKSDEEVLDSSTSTNSFFTGKQIFNNCNFNGPLMSNNTNNISNNTDSVISGSGSLDINNSNLHSTINSDSQQDALKVVKEGSPWYSIWSFILFVLMFVTFFILSFQGKEFNDQTCGLIKFLSAFLIAFSFPMITDKAKISGTAKWVEKVPVKFEFIGGFATFVIALILFNVLDLPV